MDELKLTMMIPRAINQLEPALISYRFVKISNNREYRKPENSFYPTLFLYEVYLEPPKFIMF